MRDLSDILVNPGEREVAVLGEKYLQEYMDYGVSERAFCLATDRRVYICGKCRSASGKAYAPDDGGRVIELRRIASTGIIPVRYTGTAPRVVLAVSAWSLATFLAVAALDQVLRFQFGLCAIASVCAAFYVPALVAAFIHTYSGKPEIFVLEYAGGKIGFPIDHYSDKEMQNFQQKLHGAMENLGETGTKNEKVGEKTGKK